MVWVLIIWPGICSDYIATGHGGCWKMAGVYSLRIDMWLLMQVWVEIFAGIDIFVYSNVRWLIIPCQHKSDNSLAEKVGEDGLLQLGNDQTITYVVQFLYLYALLLLA